MKTIIIALSVVVPFWLSLSTLSASILITEVVTKNDGDLADSEGEHPDWIEIYNAGPEPVSLQGCYLTDNPENLTKWQFPETTADPGQYVMVFASGKNRTIGAEFHTNFKLKDKGEFLGLVAPDGRKVYHSLESRFSEKATSFGLAFSDGIPSHSKDVVSFNSPTPGKANAEATGLPLTARTSFSVKRGFYEERILVRLSCSQPEAVIRFTTDGSKPGPETGVVYEGPIQIGNTCTLRAAAEAPGYEAGKTNTHTYIFPKSVLSQPEAAIEGWPDRRSRQRMRYGMHDGETIGSSDSELEDALRSLPSLSLVTDAPNLFDQSSGIYTNAQGRGPDWERPVSFELIDPSGSEPGFQIDGGFRIRGGFSRSGSNPKHAFRVYFRKKYGEGKLEYPLFGDEGADSFNDIDLRTAQNYSWSFQSNQQNTFIREVFSRDTQRDMGQTYTRSRYYHLYLNGLYWGLYQTQEHAEASFGASYFGGERDDYDVVKSRGFEGNNTIKATDGNLNGWRHIWQLTNRIAKERDPILRLQFYHELQGLNPNGDQDPDFPAYIDVSNLIDYMMIIFYTGNWDAPIPNRRGTRNWFGLWNRNGPRGFAFFAHDAEHSLGVNQSLNIDRTGPFEAGSEFDHCNPQWVHQQLMAVPEYCEQFGNRAQNLLASGGLLSPQAGIDRVNARAQEIERAIIAESARWGDRRLTKATWETELDRLRLYLSDRHPIVVRQLQDAKRYEFGHPDDSLVPAPLFPSLAAPTLVTTNGSDITYKASAEDVYFTTDGTDPMTSDGSIAPSAKKIRAESRTRKNLLKESAPVKVLIPEDNSFQTSWMKPTLDDSQWLNGDGIVGFDTKGDYADIITFDLEDEMFEKHLSFYARYAFSVFEQTRFDALELRVRFEDGFIAYLNGTEVARSNAPRQSTWDSEASDKHDDESARQFTRFDISDHQSLIKTGVNVLAFQVMNDDRESSDLLLGAEVNGVIFNEAETLTVAPDWTQLLARVRLGMEWSPVSTETKKTSGENATPDNPSNHPIVISEIMYHPAKETKAEKDAGFEAENFEFVEIQNTGSTEVDLSNYSFVDGIEATIPPGTKVPAGGAVVIVSDLKAFQKRYGDSVKPVTSYSGQLKNKGEEIALADAGKNDILRFEFEDKDPWPESADGLGFSLVLRSPGDGADPAEPSSWAASPKPGGSPGIADNSVQGAVSKILITEVLPHTDWPLVDQIELFNPTGETVDVSGWFLTDDKGTPKKFTLPPGSKIAPNGYLVVKEDNDGNAENNTNLPPDLFGSRFSLSSHGEEVYLFSADSKGTLTGYEYGFDFPAAQNGVSFGRVVNSAGAERFPPQQKLTFGKANSEPRTPDVQITEIHYSPSATGGHTEFVEIWNRSGRDIPLFDPENPTNTWSFSGFTYDFPPKQTLKKNEVAIISKITPEAFRKTYDLPASTKVFGPFTGSLDNAGERVSLLRPDQPDVEPDQVIVPMLTVDSVRYNDKAPWPTTPKGEGPSLERTNPDKFSDDPANWKASKTDGGTPGQRATSQSSTDASTKEENRIAPRQVEPAHVYQPPRPSGSPVLRSRSSNQTIALGETARWQAHKTEQPQRYEESRRTAPRKSVAGIAILAGGAALVFLLLSVIAIVFLIRKTGG